MFSEESGVVDSKQAFTKLMEQIILARGVPSQTAALNASVSMELSKAEHERIRALNGEAERANADYGNIVRQDELCRHQTALLEARIAAFKAQLEQSDDFFKESMGNIKSVALDPSQGNSGRVEALASELAFVLGISNEK